MIQSKKLSKFKKINHGFFNKNNGSSKGIYKSLNCGPGSKIKKKYSKNLEIVRKKLVKIQKKFFYLIKFIVINFFTLMKILLSKRKLKLML